MRKSEVEKVSRKLKSNIELLQSMNIPKITLSDYYTSTMKIVNDIQEEGMTPEEIVEKILAGELDAPLGNSTVKGYLGVFKDEYLIPVENFNDLIKILGYKLVVVKEEQ